MDSLPSLIMFNIFSRVPTKCLARSRCVSKVWCKHIDDPYLMTIHDKRVLEEPTPILYHPHLSLGTISISLCFHVLESKQRGITHCAFEPKEGPFLEYFHKEPLSESSTVNIEVRGSCNGLICLSQDEDNVVTMLVVVHPLRKECYELPPLPMHSMCTKACGLGFDASTTLKMVLVLLKAYAPPDNHDMAENLCTMVHVFGTNSWVEKPQVPPYPITGAAVFANGCLHWLVSPSIKTEGGGRHVVCFDLGKEEFGLIDPPKRRGDLWTNDICTSVQLVDLNGEVGYVCTGRTVEVWVLKQKEWVPYCRIDKEDIRYGCCIEVMGCWNKDGDLLMKIIKSSGDHQMYKFYVYNLKSGFLHETNIAGTDEGLIPKIFMYPNTLSSIHCINTNTMKKAILKRSCRRILSVC